MRLSWRACSVRKFCCLISTADPLAAASSQFGRLTCGFVRLAASKCMDSESAEYSDVLAGTLAAVGVDFATPKICCCFASGRFCLPGV